MAVSVVIPTHQRVFLLPAVIELAAADGAADDIVVVADGCTDGTQKLVRRLGAHDARIRLIDLVPNRGSQAARRAGVEAAVNPVVLCLDDDVLVAPGTVAGHARHHVTGLAQVVVGYMPVRLEPPHDVIVARYGERYERHVRGYEERPEEILSGLWEGNVSFRKADYLQAVAHSGGLQHHEDQELGLRLRDLNCTAVFDRALTAEHLYRRSLPQTLRDAWLSGVGYATLEAKYPGELPPASITFAPERSRLRRILVTSSAGRMRGPQQAAAKVALGVAKITGYESAARLLLGLLSRGQYLAGYESIAGPLSPHPSSGLD